MVPISNAGTQPEDYFAILSHQPLAPFLTTMSTYREDALYEQGNRPIADNVFGGSLNARLLILQTIENTTVFKPPSLFILLQQQNQTASKTNQQFWFQISLHDLTTLNKTHSRQGINQGYLSTWGQINRQFLHACTAITNHLSPLRYNTLWLPHIETIINRWYLRLKENHQLFNQTGLCVNLATVTFICKHYYIIYIIS